MTSPEKKAILFVNGEASFPQNLTSYNIIACTDGAYHNYLQDSGILPDFLIGDLDSIHDKPIDPRVTIIPTPAQDKTDFEKSLLFLMDKGISRIDIYGASGKSSDHFLGNLSVALQYKDSLQLTFYDNYTQFFFASPQMQFNNVKGKTISLIPFGEVFGLTLTGFEYPLTKADLKLGGLTSLRNKAKDDLVSISFEKGNLIVFITK
ncbi:thiamine diphosphokinase [Zophobihabitans entericus]|uniref:Thiamine diphosphokinase n=1 Tax=Zophobihabitans entericus TaxID=1635327 RepID=A0A6G9IDP9_9GAMM|nr:thiamine diphosphokinase [Zophobihabitans entericus]QIQ21942.1 thiamine diphosphokinase [Zophobihabitans entericus]